MNLYDWRQDYEAANRAYRLRRRLFVVGLGLLAAGTLAAAWFLSQGSVLWQ